MDRCGDGIYQVNIWMPIHAYVIVVQELREPEHGWMGSLIRQAGGECPEMRINGLGCSFSMAEF